jgi:hypothetical protein
LQPPNVAKAWNGAQSKSVTASVAPRALQPNTDNFVVPCQFNCKPIEIRAHGKLMPGNSPKENTAYVGRRRHNALAVEFESENDAVREDFFVRHEFHFG